MATKTEKNVQLKINKMTKNIFDQLSVQGLISEDELYLLSDDETGPAKWGTIGGELSNQTDLKIMLDSKADKSEIPTVNNPTITFTQGNAVKGSITLNQANDQTISLDAGGGGGGGGGDYVPLSTDIAGNKTAATIGTRNNGVLYPTRPNPVQLSAIGANTFTVGTDCAASSANSFAQGLSCFALGKNSIALGRKASAAGFDNTFVWSGDDSPVSEVVESVGPGTFNIFNTSTSDTDVLFINGKKLTEIVGGGGGGGGDDIYCKYGSTTEDPPGWFFMSIANGQTYIDYSQINSITNDSSKPSKIVGYFEFTEADGQDYEIVVGTTGYDNNNNVSFVWKGNAGSNGNIKVPFIIVYNPINYSNYIQVNGGYSTIYMRITAIYNGG